MFHLIKRWITNAFIATLLALFFIDAIPALNLFHLKIKEFLDPVYDKTGLYQGSWGLFAPMPRIINLHVSARIYYKDGSMSTWRSPDWKKISSSQKHFMTQHMKFYERIREDEAAPMWPDFCDWLRRKHRAKNQDLYDVVKIELFRHWIFTPKPDETPSFKLDYRAKEESFLMYTKTYEQ